MGSFLQYKISLPLEEQGGGRWLCRARSSIPPNSTLQR